MKVVLETKHLKLVKKKGGRHHSSFGWVTEGDRVQGDSKRWPSKSPTQLRGKTVLCGVEL